jgi:predicted nucleic-acid-binding protein
LIGVDTNILARYVLADDLIAKLNEAAGASPTMTLDRKAAQNPPFIPFSKEA